jgi:hypothetical protein
MVNIARQMGLGMDPDEFPGRYSTFEAETRRRIWWDIYYYDLYAPSFVVVVYSLTQSRRSGPLQICIRLYGPSAPRPGWIFHDKTTRGCG